MDEELAPGFKIESVEEDEEVKAFREELISKKIQDSNTVKAKKDEILRQVRQSISQGERVDITEEMEELGLEQEIRALLMAGYGLRLFYKHAYMDEDFED